jgi:hypothetical protein
MLTTTKEKVRVHPASPAIHGRHGKGTLRLNLALSDNVGMPDWFRKVGDFVTPG